MSSMPRTTRTHGRQSCPECLPRCRADHSVHAEVLRGLELADCSFS